LARPPAFDVGTRLSTPGGSPASVRRSASASIERGVRAAGLHTMVQPAAIAGPIFRVPIAIGKFHGVMNRHGPTGWRITRRRAPPLGLVVHLPSMRTASSLNHRKKSAP